MQYKKNLFWNCSFLLPWNKQFSPSGLFELEQSCSSLLIYSTRVISNLKQMPWTCEPYWFKLEQGLDGMVLVDFIVIQRVNDFGTAILILLRPTKLISLINIDILIWIFDLIFFTQSNNNKRSLVNACLKKKKKVRSAHTFNWKLKS